MKKKSRLRSNPESYLISNSLLSCGECEEIKERSRKRVEEAWEKAWEKKDETLTLEEAEALAVDFKKPAYKKMYSAFHKLIDDYKDWFI